MKLFYGQKLDKNWFKTWICPGFVLVRNAPNTGWTFLRHNEDNVQNISSFCPGLKSRDIQIFGVRSRVWTICGQTLDK